MGGRKRTGPERLVEEKHELALKSRKLGQTTCQRLVLEGACSMGEESGGEGGEAIMPTGGCVHVVSGAEFFAQEGAGGREERNEPILGAQDMEAGLAWLERCLEAEVERWNDEVVRREAAEADTATAERRAAQLETEVIRLKGLLVEKDPAVDERRGVEFAKASVEARAEEGPEDAETGSEWAKMGAEGMDERTEKVHKRLKDADKMVAEAKVAAEAPKNKAEAATTRMEEANTRAAAFTRAFAEQTGRVTRAEAVAALAQAGADALARELAQTKNAEKGLEMVGAGRLRQLLLEKSHALDEANARAEKAEMDLARANVLGVASARVGKGERNLADEVACRVGAETAAAITRENAHGLARELERCKTRPETAESVSALANARLAGMQAEVAGLKRLLVEKDRAAKEAKARAEEAEKRRAEEAIARTNWASARAEEAGDSVTEDLTQRVRAQSTAGIGQTGNRHAKKVAQPGEC